MGIFDVHIVTPQEAVWGVSDEIEKLSPEEQERFTTSVLVELKFDEVKQYLKEKYPEEFI